MRIHIITALALALTVACSSPDDSVEQPSEHSHAEAATTYTCPMHPQVKQPKPGKCPICGMDLVPMKKKPPTADATTYTCPMHPQVKQPKPGKCPICGMDLVPMKKEGAEDTASIHISDAMQRAAHIVTRRARKIRPTIEIRLTGQVVRDARRTYLQTAHIEGRIERIYVQYPGQFVRKGQPIVSLYSPPLIAAQRELLEAVRQKHTFPSLYEAAVRKLKNWKLTDAQIQAILEADSVIERFDIVADYSGYITDIHAREGMHVREGGALLSMLSVDKVWLELDVPEDHAAYVQVGMPLELRAAGSRSFAGRVSGRVPEVDPVRRALRITAVAHPTGFALIPGMLVEGSALYTWPDSAVVVPPSAILWTGDESLVYVRTGPESFALRKVHTAARAREGYILTHGLRPGEEYVAEGTFRVDAAAQLAGKPSMLEGGGGHHH